MTDALIQTWQPIAELWAQQMLLWSWRALLVIGATCLIGLFRRRGSAAARHQLWLTGLIAVAALPLWSAAAQLLPAWRGPEALTTLASLPISMTEAVGRRSAGAIPEAPLSPGAEARPAQSAAGWRTSIVPGLLLVWCIGVLACLAGFLRYCNRARHLRRAAVGVHRLRTPRGLDVAVGYSSAAGAPQLVGARHPMILLPADIEEWSSREEIRGVLLHEMAHLDRRDPYTNVFQALLTSLLFFHPAVRYGLGRLRVERELACDEAVAASGMDRPTYAGAILSAAAHSIGARHWSGIAFDSPKKVLERRIDMILNSNPVSGGRGLRGASLKAHAALLLAVAACLALPQSQSGTEAELPVQQQSSESQVSVTLETQEAAGAANFRGGVSGVGASVVAAAMTPREPAPQAPAASLSGRVVDQTGAVIPGVTVKANSAGETVMTAVTNSTGDFTFSPLPANTYEIEASLPGFRTQRLNVNLQESANVGPLTLHIGGVTTMVEVMAQRTQRAAPSPPPIRVGGDVSQANLLYAPKPQYPPLGRAVGAQGTVTIQAVITVDGSIASPQVVSGGHPDLTSAALEAVKQWRYRPALLNGVPIEILTTVTVNFSLTD